MKQALDPQLERQREAPGRSGRVRVLAASDSGQRGCAAWTPSRCNPWPRRRGQRRGLPVAPAGARPGSAYGVEGSANACDEGGDRRLVRDADRVDAVRSRARWTASDHPCSARATFRVVVQPSGGLYAPIGFARSFRKASLSRTRSPTNSNRSTPRYVIGGPPAGVPLNVHWTTARSPTRIVLTSE